MQTVNEFRALAAQLCPDRIAHGNPGDTIICEYCITLALAMKAVAEATREHLADGCHVVGQHDNACFDSCTKCSICLTDIAKIAANRLITSGESAEEAV